MKGLVPAAVIVSCAALGWLQYSTPHLVDRDSYYHARYAQMLPERGLSRHFEWTQESVWKDAFSDKEFLHHVLLAPFCREGREVSGAKAATWIFGCGVVIAFAFVLVRLKIRFASFWVLLLPALGNHFLFRMMPARPQILSVLLLLLGIGFLLEQKWRAAAIVGFIYSWTYTASHLLIAFAAIDTLARWALDRKFNGRGLAWVAGGVIAGIVIHPYFPNNVKLWWVMNVQIMAQAWSLGGDVGLRLGSEFEPVFPRSLIVSSTLVMICFLGSFGIAMFRSAEFSPRTRRLGAISIGGFLLYCMSGRFVEYFAPLALLAAASVTSDLWPVTWTRRRAGFAAAAGLIAFGLGARSMHDAIDMVKGMPGPDLAGVARWTKEHVPAGETIVHLDWGDFVQLYHFDPTHRYLVGLDPMFLYVRNPGKSRLIDEMKSGKRFFDGAELGREFGARYLVARNRLRGTIEQSGINPVFLDSGGAVYKIGE